MNYLIDTIAGAPRESLTMEMIQEVIDELQRALGEAFDIREELKLEYQSKPGGEK